jgi:hypothetical protein
MIVEFIDFATSALPSIDPYKAETAKHAIKNFLLQGTRIDLSSPPADQELCQGDTIGPLVFSYVDADGVLKKKTSYACVLSNSCDIDNDVLVVVCACYPIEDFLKIFVRTDQKRLTKNEYGHLFYIVNSRGLDFVADFSDCMTYSKELLVNLLKDGRIRRDSKLTRIGWYFFLVKLTYHFMRPEDTKTNENRANF